MSSWDVYVQINGEEWTEYSVVNVDVSDDEYKILTETVDSNKPLTEAPCYESITNRAMDLYDFEDYLDEDDKPCKEDYLEDFDPDDEENEEEYEIIDYNGEKYLFDREGYEDDLDSYYSQLDYIGFADVVLYDPGEFLRFRNKFIGRNYPRTETINVYETGERIVDYDVTLVVENGIINDIEIDGFGLESDGVKGGSTGCDVHPDFEYISGEIESEIAETLSEPE